jgi:hypothetical protein
LPGFFICTHGEIVAEGGFFVRGKNYSLTYPGPVRINYFLSGEPGSTPMRAFLALPRQKPGFPLQSFLRPRRKKGFPLLSLAPHGRLGWF